MVRLSSLCIYVNCALNARPKHRQVDTMEVKLPELPGDLEDAPSLTEENSMEPSGSGPGPALDPC